MKANLAQPIREIVVTSTVPETYWTAETADDVTVIDWYAEVGLAPRASLTTNTSWLWAAHQVWRKTFGR